MSPGRCSTCNGPTRRINGISCCIRPACPGDFPQAKQVDAERCRCGGAFRKGAGVVPLVRCVTCAREVPAAALPSTPDARGARSGDGASGQNAGDVEEARQAAALPFGISEQDRDRD
jgi:hypothetical protein